MLQTRAPAANIRALPGLARAPPLPTRGPVHPGLRTGRTPAPVKAPGTGAGAIRQGTGP